jgi:hypothetical protein
VTLLAAVAVLSASTLALEVLLVRLFSIAQWHHFAYMIISMALLGYGASGTVLFFVRERLVGRVHTVFAVAAAAFAVTTLVGFALARHIPLNVLELAWDFRQQAWLPALYILLALPFFCTASAVGLALAAAGERVGAIYRSDLMGAGIGAIAVVAVLGVFPLGWCLPAVAAGGLTAATIAACHHSVSRPLAVILVLLTVAVPLAWPLEWARPVPSPYKDLSLAMTIPGSHVVAERSGPFGLLTVVGNAKVPFRHVPGLSLLGLDEPPDQLAVFTDAGGMTAISRFDGRLDSLSYLDHQTAALAFQLLNQPRVLILGAGGGADVLLALRHGARRIDAVDIDPNMVELVRHTFADYAGHLYGQPGVDVHVAEARAFVEGAEGPFDLIHVALLDSFTAAAAGLHALSESTLYTAEAFALYLDRLTPESGLLAVTRWLKVPPRDSLKLLATAATVLEQRGVADASRHLVLVHGWRTATLLVKAGPLTADDVAAVRRFCADNGFDVAYHPDIAASDVNRFNVFDRPYLYEGAVALLGPARESFFRDYRFDVRPSTDDRPYFFHFLKGSTLIELLRSRDRGGLTLVEWGYPVLWATLIQALVFSVVLILVPLVALRRQPASRPPPAPSGSRIAIYFFCLGLAFLFVEMAFIQRFQLFLGHPLRAVAVALGAFLMFAGIGSGIAGWWTARLGSAERAVAVAIAAIAAVSALYVAALPTLFAWLAPASPTVRIGAAVLLVAPLAFFMGLPFPVGLAATAVRAPALVPWAWGINGCASVLSAVAATVVAIHAGFTAVLAAAIVLYAVAGVAFAAGPPPSRERPFSAPSSSGGR